MKAIFSLIIFSLTFGAQANVDESQYKDDAENIHMRLRVQEVADESVAAGEESKDITTESPHLLALTGKEEQMPQIMKDNLVKRRAFHLCRSHGFSAVESKKPKIKLVAAVSADKDFKVLQWMEGNLTPISASKTTHWMTTNDNGRGRHEDSGPFAIFGSLICVR